MKTIITILLLLAGLSLFAQGTAKNAVFTGRDEVLKHLNDSTQIVPIDLKPDQVVDLTSYDTQQKELDAEYRNQSAIISASKKAYLLSAVRGSGKVIDLSKVIPEGTKIEGWKLLLNMKK